MTMDSQHSNALRQALHSFQGSATRWQTGRRPARGRGLKQ